MRAGEETRRDVCRGISDRCPHIVCNEGEFSTPLKEMMGTGDTWVAQSVVRFIFVFGSGHDLRL